MEGRSFAAHDSRQLRYRFPFGAVTEGERITLNIDCGAGVRNAKLRIWTEGRERIEHGVRTDAGFSFTFYAGTSGLEWYYFLLDTDEGGYILGSESPLGCGGSRIFTHDPNSWQITVYEREFETPKAAEGATAYQIFPDRFNRIGRGGLARTGRREELGWTTVKHGDWNEEVLWTPLPGQKDYDPCDFYGGDFEGIEAKLDYLQSIGVTLIYMNPVFEAQSNHRYNTGDYHRADDMLGGEEGLKKLIRAARARGIGIMLDGVFSHTGDESVYFNRRGNYPGLGAYQGEGSAYYDWYGFSRFPDKYGCWWGFKSLPEVNENNRGYMAFVAGVIDHYAKLGIESWRLDVADELPDEFIAFLRRELKARAKDGILIGEVWEDASTKQGGCGRRKYTDGRELDGVMNYVFADAVISFLTGKQDAEALCLALTALRQNYPKPFYDSCLTMLSRPRYGKASHGACRRAGQAQRIAGGAGALCAGGKQAQHGEKAYDARAAYSAYPPWHTVHILRGRGGHAGHGGPVQQAYLSLGQRGCGNTGPLYGNRLRAEGQPRDTPRQVRIRREG